MKRYKVVARTRDVGPGYAELRENPDGEVLKYEDVKKLVELNREMVEALEHITEYWNGGQESAVDAIEHAIETAGEVLAKAEGVQ